MKSLSTPYTALAFILCMSGTIPPLTQAKVTEQTTKTPLSPSFIHQKKPVRMEQLIAQTRNKHGKDIIIEQAQLTTLDQHQAVIIQFMDPGGVQQKVVYNALTGKELDQMPVQDLLPFEQIVEKALSRHKNSVAKSSRRSENKGIPSVVVDLIDTKNKRWEVTLDAHTGMLINEHTCTLTYTGKQLSLVSIIEKARTIEKNAVVLRTRKTFFGNQPVREIVLRDKYNVNRKLIFNAHTGALIKNKPVGGYQF